MIKKINHLLMYALVINLVGCASQDIQSEKERNIQRNKSEIHTLESYCDKSTDFEWYCKGITIKLNKNLLIEQGLGNISEFINLTQLNNSLAMKVERIEDYKYTLELIFKPIYANLGANCKEYVCLDAMNAKLFQDKQMYKWRLGFIFNYQKGLTYSNSWYRKVIDNDIVRFSTYGTRKIIIRLDPDEYHTELYITPYIDIQKRFYNKPISYGNIDIFGEAVWYSTVEECEQCVYY